SDPARHAAMSRAARDAATAHFSIETEADGIARVLDQMRAEHAAI
ncbi:MAG: lipopolysaccharide biosynthesis protein, partial [Roseovarius sp.]|nr:lipopolysaccharide biosynthesis protein [Roseovarius sp.]